MVRIPGCTGHGRPIAALRRHGHGNAGQTRADGRSQIAAQGPAPDNLEIIEGIGPTIAGVLQAAGIRTFAQLADADPGRDGILNEAGIGNLADPSSWSEQAGLAADGKLDELAALQARLKAGRNEE